MAARVKDLRRPVGPYWPVYLDVFLGLIHLAGLKAFRDKLKSGLANVELAQQFRELPRQNGFRDIGLRAAAFVARAAIVDVATFLDVSGQGAATMAAAHERRNAKSFFARRSFFLWRLLSAS